MEWILPIFDVVHYMVSLLMNYVLPNNHLLSVAYIKIIRIDVKEYECSLKNFIREYLKTNTSNSNPTRFLD